MADTNNTQALHRARRYVYGFDYLRAFFSLCVVLVHLGYVAPSSIFDPSKWQRHVFVLSDAINFYVLLAAVPVFYLVAGYLVAMNKNVDVWPRVWRALRLLVFWGLLLNLYQLSGRTFVASIPRNPVHLLLYVTSGFNTVYYFFFSLAMVLLLTQAARQWSNKAIFSFSLLMLLLIGLLPWIVMRCDLPQLLSWSFPLNFLPYPFLAIAIERLQGPRAFWSIVILMAAGLALATLDWTIYPNPDLFHVSSFAIPVYARPSLICLSTGVVLGATLLTSPAPSIISFMSTHSLALYCLHPFTLWGVQRVTKHLDWPGFFSLPTQLALVLLLCYICSAMILPFFLKRDIFR
ncbi:MAG: acyltransferase family protein [Cyanobacteriota bacterium]